MIFVFCICYLKLNWITVNIKIPNNQKYLPKKCNIPIGNNEISVIVIGPGTELRINQ